MVKVDMNIVCYIIKVNGDFVVEGILWVVFDCLCFVFCFEVLL